MVYANGYMASPEKRSLGFLISTAASAVLLVLAIWGVIVSWMAATAV